MSGGGASRNLNSVFYAESYHPIQAGSIDGTDIAPHDNAVYRALLCSSAGLYDPLGDPKLLGDPYCTVFVGRLSHLTTEESLRKAMSKYGRVKNSRLVRDIVTGASRGYAFVEFETDREMRRAFKEAHHSLVDDSEIIVDYSRQQLMPGWIPRRLGGGLGGRKESGQLRFGGRERPFRAPLRPIPHDDLKRLGIPPPPEGRYMSRFQVPSPPRRKRSSVDRELSTRSSSAELEDYDRWKPVHKEHRYSKRETADKEEHRSKRSSRESRGHSDRRTSREDRDYHRDRSSEQRERRYDKSSHVHRETSHKRYMETEDRSESSDKRSSRHEVDSQKHQKHDKHGRRLDKHKRKRSRSRDHFSDH